MKTIFKTIAVASLALFVSCNSNDDDSTSNNGGSNASLVGIWDLDDSDGEISVTTNGLTVNGTISGSNYDNSTITFTENPNKLDIAFDYTMTTSVTFLGMTQTEDEDINEAETGLDWTKNNNILSVSGSTADMNLDFEIVEHTNTELVLKAQFNESDTIAGEITSTSGYINYHYSK